MNISVRKGLYRDTVIRWASKHSISYVSALSIICETNREGCDPYAFTDFDELSQTLYSEAKAEGGDDE